MGLVPESLKLHQGLRHLVVHADKFPRVPASLRLSEGPPLKAFLDGAVAQPSPFFRVMGYWVRIRA